ncbi:hypothetical protein WKW79_10940 [Variovorax robiniae]|uniref:Major facilitator superfamily (MFS) profile domain-containing protein n=1 Tax=Variovorax robiniae TaxID=1836199 RepID=A0ABU8X5I4_9BURK
MQQLSWADRICSAVLGALFGAIVGLAIAWLVGVYSNTLGAAAGPLCFTCWSSGCAALFGVIGLVFGPAVATVLGHVITGIFEFERLALPLWVVIASLLAAAAWFLWWPG